MQVASVASVVQGIILARAVETGPDCIVPVVSGPKSLLEISPSSIRDHDHDHNYTVNNRRVDGKVTHVPGAMALLVVAKCSAYPPCLHYHRKVAFCHMLSTRVISAERLKQSFDKQKRLVTFDELSISG